MYSMDPEEFLQKRKEQNEKTKKRVRTICIVACILWIPVAMLIYRPSLLFENEHLFEGKQGQQDSMLINSVSEKANGQ